jgi:hypothetical protein
MALKVFVPSNSAANGNYGIVAIDSAGTVFPVAIPAPSPILGLGNNNYRFPAGDVTPDGSTMYVNAQVTSNASDANRRLYIVDLTAAPVTAAFKDKTRPAGFTVVNVADWAVNPIDGLLYGASYAGQIFSMDPTTSPNATMATVTSAGFLPGGSPGQPLDAYGGCWFSADGHFFAYRNRGEIYEIDLVTPAILTSQFGGPSSTFNDAAACTLAGTAPDIDIQKTVYEGWDSGASAPGVEFINDPVDGEVTYVYIVTNTGGVDLYNIAITDAVLGITEADLTLIPGLSDPSPPLAPSGKLVYYIEGTVTENLVNTVCVAAETIEQVPVEACDDAAVLVPCDPFPPMGEEGCTPGYWKQPHHFDSWPVAYDPVLSYFDGVFGVGPNITLLAALELEGGGEEALIRHAVAALLNAATLDDYAYSVEAVIEMVEAAYASGDFEPYKMMFETENEMGCPLD